MLATTQGGEKLKLSWKKSHVAFGLLLALVVLNLASSQRVYAEQVVIDRSPPFDSYRYARGGDEASAYARASDGWHTVHVAGNSWAYAQVSARNHYTGTNLDRIRIDITVNEGYVAKDWAGNSYADLWVELWDLTTGQELYDGRQTYQNTQPPGYTYFFPVYKNIISGHDYEIWAGVSAGSRWFFIRGWADAHGYVTRIYAHQF